MAFPNMYRAPWQDEHGHSSRISEVFEGVPENAVVIDVDTYEPSVEILNATPDVFMTCVKQEADETDQEVFKGASASHSHALVTRSHWAEQRPSLPSTLPAETGVTRLELNASAFDEQGWAPFEEDTPPPEFAADAVHQDTPLLEDFQEAAILSPAKVTALFDFTQLGNDINTPTDMTNVHKEGHGNGEPLSPESIKESSQSRPEAEVPNSKSSDLPSWGSFSSQLHPFDPNKHRESDSVLSSVNKKFQTDSQCTSRKAKHTDGARRKSSQDSDQTTAKFAELDKNFSLRQREKRRPLTQTEKERQLARQREITMRVAKEPEHDTDYLPKDSEAAGTVGTQTLEADLGILDVENSDIENQLAIKAFRALKKHYKNKTKKGMTTIVDDISFMKVENAENDRLARLKQRKEFETAEKNRSETIGDSESDTSSDSEAGELFLNDDPQSSNKGKRKRGVGDSEDDCDDYGNVDSDGLNSAHLGDLAGKKPRNQRSRAARKAFHIPGSKKEQDQSIQEGLDAIRRKRKRVEKSANRRPREKRAKSDGLASSRKSQKQKKGEIPIKASKRKSAKKAKYAGPPTANLKSLFGDNVFEASKANAEEGDQPTFMKGRRCEALKSIIASIPSDEARHGKADAKAMEAAIKNCTHGRRVKVHADGLWRVKGMTCSLKNFQIIGLSFLRGRETGSRPPFGGIIADTMGLGKTIQLIANMVDGKPTPNTKIKTTLIVVPNSLVYQWMREIQDHCDPDVFPDILEYHGKSRPKGSNVISILQQQDVVITTYTEVRKSYPKHQPPIEMTEAEQEEWWKEYFEKSKGDLQRVHWHRIILDEAQAVKNFDTQTALAVRGLMGRYRWVCTGTPLSNSTTEFYSLFRFLKAPLTGSFELFRKNYLDSQSAIARLTTILPQIMLRRTYEDKIFGKPIMQLPPSQQLTTYVNFTKLEREIYNIVRRRCIRTIWGYIKNGILAQKYSHVLYRLLLLRQMTGHFFCIENALQDILVQSDVEKLARIASREPEEENSKALLKHLRRVLKTLRVPESPSSDHETQEDPETDAEEEELGGPFGTLDVDFMKYLEHLRDTDKWKDLIDRSLCSQCDQPPDEPQVLSCYHILCMTCLNHVKWNSKRENGSPICPARGCEKLITNSEPCTTLARLNNSSGSRSRSKKAKKRSKKNDSREDDSEEEPLGWLDVGDHVYPSAKTLAIKAQVLNWFKEEPDTKIIIYTQFHIMMRILVRICEQENWGFCEYHGKMNMEAKDKAIESFQQDEDKKILLATLKSGGIGLNLTQATKVIILDLYWNSSQEQQAFCRVYRIGQNKPTTLLRLAVRKSVDEYILRMQTRKEKAIAAAMGEDKNVNHAPTVEELLKMFGPGGEDGEAGGGGFLIPSEDIFGDLESGSDLEVDMDSE